MRHHFSDSFSKCACNPVGYWHKFSQFHPCSYWCDIISLSVEIWDSTIRIQTYDFMWSCQVTRIPSVNKDTGVSRSSWMDLIPGIKLWLTRRAISLLIEVLFTVRIGFTSYEFVNLSACRFTSSAGLVTTSDRLAAKTIMLHQLQELFISCSIRGA
jgi:hypothetical protein